MEEEAQAGVETAFKAYGRPLEAVTSFKHLGRLLTATDNYWPPVIANIQKVNKSWSRLLSNLGWEGADTWTSGCFYLIIVQAILFLGAENWVMTLRTGRMLGGLHHRVAQQISGK